MMDIRISTRIFLLASVFVWACYPASAYTDDLQQLKCWNGHSLATREGMVCVIHMNLESMWGREVRYFLETHTDLIPGEVNDVIPIFFLQWAECKYAAYVNFSKKRPDIPLRLILIPEISEPTSDEELVLASQFSGFDPLNEELEKCKLEAGEETRKYLPNSLNAE